MYGAGRLLLIVVAIALSVVAGWRLAVRWAPSRDIYPVQGIDVSEANGAIEWPVAKGAGVDFGYAVATRGDNVRDRAFQTNRDAMAAADVRRGAIHVFSSASRAATRPMPSTRWCRRWATRCPRRSRSTTTPAAPPGRNATGSWPRWRRPRGGSRRIRACRYC
ncbi:GH25 family lysozyme [Sphingomonas sp. MMS24-JH45]